MEIQLKLVGSFIPVHFYERFAELVAWLGPNCNSWVIVHDNREAKNGEGK